MKILITGGNRGLGKILATSLSADSISRQSGFDITKDVNSIVDKSLDYDVFINNAFDGPPQEEWANFGQSQLLIKMFQKWKEKNKTGWIFNIGSIASDDNVSPNPDWETYRVSKKSLEAASLQCSRAFRNNEVSFRTTLIKPDRLNTDLARSRPNWTGNGINCKDIATFINYCLDINKNTQIDQITISLNYDYKK
jgi:NAD(P)-dependent dehydrogenase (short-subunit alcohol dehydrogenase family)|tara:strand:- start:802 stop:1386 length:585 start_codon:yes stop_codon:yes gene_type:complete